MKPLLWIILIIFALYLYYKIQEKNSKTIVNDKTEHNATNNCVGGALDPVTGEWTPSTCY